MRPLALVLVMSAQAAADPKPQPLGVVPVDVDFCDQCKLVSHDTVAGVGTVEVYDTVLALADKPVSEVTIVIQTAREKVGAHLDLHASPPHDVALREAHRIAGFHDGIVTDRKATPHDAVALWFDVDRKRDGTAYRESYAVACSGTGGWACSVVRLGEPGRACSLTAWEPPRVDYRCDGRLALTARPK